MIRTEYITQEIVSGQEELDDKKRMYYRNKVEIFCKQRKARSVVGEKRADGGGLRQALLLSAMYVW